MKKFTTISTFVFALLMMVSTNMQAQKFSSLDKSPLDIASFPNSYKDSKKEMKVIYSRPQLKDRALSKLAPNGKVWRTGANEAAELVIYSDINLGGTSIKAGTYSLFTIPGDNEWTVILSSDLNVWGSYSYNKANDVARITVPVATNKDSIEAFSIALEEGENGIDMYLAWSTTIVKVPFTK